MYIKVDLNIGVREWPDGPLRRREALRSAKMFLIPSDRGTLVIDSSIPDFLVSESMIDRYLGIRPPHLRVTTRFDLIIKEIERTFVVGQFFAAVAASVVTIERMLNDARQRLHHSVSPKKGDLWGKGPLNDWTKNIDALVEWRFLEAELGSELKGIKEIRDRYLHSGPIDTPEADARRCVDSAFRLLAEFIGFPPRLFRIGGAIECTDTTHPLFQVFYKPELMDSVTASGSV